MKSQLQEIQLNEIVATRVDLFIRFNSGRKANETCQPESVFLVSKMSKTASHCRRTKKCVEAQPRATAGVGTISAFSCRGTERVAVHAVRVHACGAPPRSARLWSDAAEKQPGTNGGRKPTRECFT